MKDRAAEHYDEKKNDILFLDELTGNNAEEGKASWWWLFWWCTCHYIGLTTWLDHYLMLSMVFGARRASSNRSQMPKMVAQNIRQNLVENEAVNHQWKTSWKTSWKSSDFSPDEMKKWWNVSLIQNGNVLGEKSPGNFFTQPRGDFFQATSLGYVWRPRGKVFHAALLE